MKVSSQLFMGLDTFSLQIAVLSDDANAIARKRCLRRGADQYIDESIEIEQALLWVQRQVASH